MTSKTMNLTPEIEAKLDEVMALYESVPREQWPTVPNEEADSILIEAIKELKASAARYEVHCNATAKPA